MKSVCIHIIESDDARQAISFSDLLRGTCSVRLLKFKKTAAPKEKLLLSYNWFRFINTGFTGILYNLS